MIRTIEPFMGPAFVVVREELHNWREVFYAEAHPAWLRGDPDVTESDAAGEWGIDRGRSVGDGLSPLRNTKWCRWWDMLDDGTWFVNEADAAALALLVDGRVYAALDAIPANDSDRYLLMEREE